MQIAEDMQLIAGHMLMQWLYAQRGASGAGQALNVRVAVLGSSSFAARRFVDAALSVGHDVLGITARRSLPHLPAYRGNLRAAALTVPQLDLNTDFEAIWHGARRVRTVPNRRFRWPGYGRGKAGATRRSGPDEIVSKVRLHEFLRQLRGLQKYVRVLDTGSLRQLGYADPGRTGICASTPYAVSHRQ